VVEESIVGPAGPRAPLTLLRLLGQPSSDDNPVVPSVPPPPTAPWLVPLTSPRSFGPALWLQPPPGPIAPSVGSGAAKAIAAAVRTNSVAVRGFSNLMAAHYRRERAAKAVAAQGTEGQQSAQGRRAGVGVAGGKAWAGSQPAASIGT
jgi:hypothetical protein